jgi:nicotinamide riboside kinase
MEKRIKGQSGKLIRVVITGPECTGKSTLALQLARHYQTVSIPEYARDYIANLDRPYTYEDVQHIAGIQLKQSQEIPEGANKLIFFDTWLDITKVWFEVVYGHYPAWLDEALIHNQIDLFLLCSTDIEWVSDPVRENGGIMREKLYFRYKTELDKLGCPYHIIDGIGEQRMEKAIRIVDGFLQQQSGDQ